MIHHQHPTTPGTRVAQRPEDGSIAIFMSVMLITTGLIVATLFAVTSGLKGSRRAGDSANALQVADAGINDAVKAVPTVAGNTFTRSGSLGSGSFTYTATRDANDPSIWHIDGYGVDATGAKRRIKADASGQSIFQAPLFVNKGLSASSGVYLDSFSGGENLSSGCTGHGIMFFDPAATVTFGAKGGGNANCSSLVYGGSWDFVMDGCQVFGASGTQSLPPQGSGACPPANDPNFPGRTKKILQDFFPPNIDLTGVTACNPVSSALSDATTVCINMPSASFPGTSFTCDPNWNGATSGATAGAKKLIAGFTYYYSTINLNSGCTIDTSTINGGNSTTNGDWVSSHPTRMYALVININTGTKGLINQPPTATFPNICSSAARPTTNPSTWSYNDISSPQNPSSYYCSGWAKSLQLNILDSATSSSTISGNGGKFWGTWLGPKGAITLNSPQMEFWGAMMSGNVSVKNQFSWHYDDSLSSIRSTRYSVNNWREEPLG